MYIQRSLHHLSVNAGKLRLYKKLKSEYSMESYLYHSDFELRSALCKMRISTHSLEIERGRYKKLSVDERTCNYCSGKAVEDELHFICQCSHYSSERNKRFLRIYKLSQACITLPTNKNQSSCLSRQTP